MMTVLSILNLVSELAHLYSAAKAMQLRTALLLHGPAGVGKRSAAAAAAAALGAHFVSFSSHELLTEGRARGRLLYHPRVTSGAC